MVDAPLSSRVDRYSATWTSIEAYLINYIKMTQETLETPRETGLERFDQGKIRACRDLLEAARPLRPEGERGPESGTNYGMQGL
jgi:hypothetical protein